MHVATQYASDPCKLTISSYLFARWYLFRHVGYLRHQQVDLWPFHLESGVRDDVCYLCANFSLPRPLCSRVRRQTDVKRLTKASLNASALWGRRHNNRPKMFGVSDTAIEQSLRPWRFAQVCWILWITNVVWQKLLRTITAIFGVAVYKILPSPIVGCLFHDSLRLCN